MKNIILVAALVLGGCGRGALLQTPTELPIPVQSAEPLQPILELGPQQQLPALLPTAPQCIVDEGFGNSQWQCETVRALEIVSLKVTNADGSEPWSSGEPRVTALMKNVTGQFLNYPSVQVAASAPSLNPAYVRETLYGMDGCSQTEMTMQFRGLAPKGTQVTFTAIPAHINGDECVLAKPAVTLTISAP